MEHETMTVAEVAKALKVHKRTVQRLFVTGEIPGAFGVGNQWRISAADFEQWIAAQKAKVGA